jgi:hypothetical protein
MSAGDFGRRLSSQDASFLYFEKEEAPLHIGSIAVLEGDVSYERFVESIEKKLHLIPRYLQRVVPRPSTSAPTWEWERISISGGTSSKYRYRRPATTSS